MVLTIPRFEAEVLAEIVFGFRTSRHLIGAMQASDDLKLLREYAINHSESAFEGLVSRPNSLGLFRGTEADE